MVEIAIGAFTVLSTLVGGIVWLVRLEGRINLLFSQQGAMDKRIDGLEERILDSLRRIETRLDTLVDRP
jgi:hypothetical protein